MLLRNANSREVVAAAAATDGVGLKGGEPAQHGTAVCRQLSYVYTRRRAVGGANC